MHRLTVTCKCVGRMNVILIYWPIDPAVAHSYHEACRALYEPWGYEVYAQVDLASDPLDENLLIV